MATTSRIGVEEELHVVDLETRTLVSRAPELLARLPGSFAPELLGSVVETNSGVWADLSDLRADLLALRRRAAAEADGLGLGLVSSGTVPLVDPDNLVLTDGARFAHMAEEYQLLVREQLICGTQVHVDVPDRDTAVAVARRLSPTLPVLLALSASSPYWHGRDTGYASARTLMWQRWPTSGAHGEATTAADYDCLLADLVASGTVSDTGMAYFDVRPSAHLPTIELRLTDACPDVDDVVLLAALFRALVRRECASVAAGQPAVLPAAPVLRAAGWRAARSGLEGDLIDLTRSTGPVPAAVAVRGLVDGLRGWLEDAGDWETVSQLMDAVLRRGSAAAVQRRVLRRTGRLVDVVDDLAARTRGEPRGHSLWHSYGSSGSSPEVVGDEALDRAGAVRAPYVQILGALDELGPAGMDHRELRRDSRQRAQGLTFRPAGHAQAQLFPVDLVPRVVSADDWRQLSAGLVQRARALDAFLHDVYDKRRVLADGVLPAWVVEQSPGLDPAGPLLRGQAVRAHVSGMDLVRSASGGWCVLEDNLRVPSGIGYAISTRRLLQHAVPELVPSRQVLPVEQAPALLRQTLLAAAPASAGPGEPFLVLLSDGPDDSAWYEHSLLADEMGIPVAQAHQLAAEDGGVVLIDDDHAGGDHAGGDHAGGDHAGGDQAGSDQAGSDQARGRRRRVDVVYLRMGDQSLAARSGADGRPLGAMLVEAASRGRVALANAPGNGVADDKALYAFVPELVRYYLGEDALLANVPTYLCREPAQLELALARAPELVFKPVDGYGGQGVLVGPHATARELEDTLRQVRQDPQGWIAQETVSLSTLPTYDGQALVPRHVDLRAFVLLGDRAVVAPAALTRVAPEGSMVVNSSRGGGAKDTWLLT